MSDAKTPIVLRIDDEASEAFKRLEEALAPVHYEPGSIVCAPHVREALIAKGARPELFAPYEVGIDEDEHSKLAIGVDFGTEDGEDTAVIVRELEKNGVVWPKRWTVEELEARRVPFVLDLTLVPEPWKTLAEHQIAIREKVERAILMGVDAVAQVPARLAGSFAAMNVQAELTMARLHEAEQKLREANAKSLDGFYYALVHPRSELARMVERLRQEIRRLLKRETYPGGRKARSATRRLREIERDAPSIMAGERLRFRLGPPLKYIDWDGNEEDVWFEEDENRLSEP